MTTSPELRVESGAVLALRLYDVAYSTDLQKVEQIWTQRGAGSAQRRRLQAPAKALAYDVPPVSLRLEPVELQLDSRLRVRLDVTARLYDFGVLVLELKLDASNLPWSEYTGRIEALNLQIGPHAGAGPWGAILRELCVLLMPAFTRPSQTALQEDYLIAVVRSFGEPLTAAELESRVNLLPVLSGETRTLSDGARRDLVRQHFSYYPDDLAIVTWDRAFIYEPRGDSDVIDVLEVANAQLLELRYYDELLDDELPRMYDLVEETRRGMWALAPGRYAALARRLYHLVAEVTELREKVDNALQVTEDVYLARIYSAAMELFRVNNVGAAVDRKLAIIRDTYTALYDEASGSRAELLELTIIFLIVVEIALALFRH